MYFLCQFYIYVHCPLQVAISQLLWKLNLPQHFIDPLRQKFLNLFLHWGKVMKNIQMNLFHLAVPCFNSSRPQVELVPHLGNHCFKGNDSMHWTCPWNPVNAFELRALRLVKFLPALSTHLSVTEGTWPRGWSSECSPLTTRPQTAGLSIFRIVYFLCN